MRFDEIAPQKPLSPEQARLKSMKDRVKRDQEAVNAERARQKIKVGQAELMQIENAVQDEQRLYSVDDCGHLRQL